MRQAPRAIVAAFAASLCLAAAQPTQPPASGEGVKGMDEAVNINLAREAGRERAGRPFLDTESLGDLWNLLLLTGGAVPGFIVGRYWDQILGRKRRADQ